MVKWLSIRRKISAADGRAVAVEAAPVVRAAAVVEPATTVVEPAAVVNGGVTPGIDEAI